ncbi:MAG: VC1465 family Xer recombination activation factor [Rhodoferax sp.]|nr:VC1465 family Xer recombination activation factor [Rhodoferax sp.]
MKYSHRSNYRKTCPHDPETRAQLGQRLHYARCKLGWSVEDAGKYFQVTDRTWHNWENGSHRIPYAVYKLARILARLELPSEAWAGWRIEGNLLITPEGRQITPQDGSWWSLLIRQARCFRSAMAEMTRLRLLLNETKDADGLLTGCVSAPESAVGAGLVTYKTSGNLTGSTDVINASDRHQNDVIIESWPILYDFQKPLTPLHAPKPTTLVSASTRSFALPWTPTCENRADLLRPDQSQTRSLQSHLKQLTKVQSLSNPQSSQGPKSKPLTKPEKPCSVSARPSEAKASASRTGGQS